MVDHVLDPMHHLIHGPWHASAQALHAAPPSDPMMSGCWNSSSSVDPDAPMGDVVIRERSALWVGT